MRKLSILLAIIGIISIVYVANKAEWTKNLPFENEAQQLLETVKENLNHPLSIESLRTKEYPGSDLVIEQTLPNGTSYDRYVASYMSEGNKIYGLLTIPRGNKPDKGWPVIVFNHGYIPPKEYKTTEKYVAYQDGFARSNYITFKPDYRGHGESGGEAAGGYGSTGYTTDVLNAVESLRKHKDVDSGRIGMWGHSMGGYITLRAMVAQQNIKAAVVWAGVVGSYSDLLTNWSRRNFTPPPGIPPNARRWRQTLLDMYGSPESNPEFWNSISANSYLSDISGPIQIHHGTNDASVPVEFSQKLAEQIRAAGKETELYIYQGDDHNISRNFSTAMSRSIAFFDKYLK